MGSTYFLDYLLTEIRVKTISYVAYKKKKNKDTMEATLDKEIHNPEPNLTENVQDILTQKQNKLENICKFRLRGHVVKR